jgi:hypothetical protein
LKVHIVQGPLLQLDTSLRFSFLLWSRWMLILCLTFAEFAPIRYLRPIASSFGNW